MLAASFRNFTARIQNLMQNATNSDLADTRNKFDNERHLARFTLVHTLSHLLIKELEFMCGYPATSLSERLFIDEERMQGVLLYTVAGAEGSYGGLVSQATNDRFLTLLTAALYRATDCASDPVCYDTEDGQGVCGLNMAACYSCTLIPENACEEYNSFLDRALLIDPKYGFYKQFV